MPYVGHKGVCFWTNAQHRGVYRDRRGAKEERGREREAMSLWRRIVVLVVTAAVMAFMSAPAAWAGGYGDDHGKKDDDKYHCEKYYKDHGKKNDDDDKYCDKDNKDKDKKDKDKDKDKKDDGDKDHDKDDDDKDKKHYS
jgi:hypothetical protein